jgi:hypothetical protein
MSKEIPVLGGVYSLVSILTGSILSSGTFTSPHNNYKKQRTFIHSESTVWCGNELLMFSVHIQIQAHYKVYAKLACPSHHSISLHPKKNCITKARWGIMHVKSVTFTIKKSLKTWWRRQQCHGYYGIRLPMFTFLQRCVNPLFTFCEITPK